MKTIRLETPLNNRTKDPTWAAVQQDRVDNNVMIELIHVDCSCGAQSLWSCETTPVLYENVGTVDIPMSVAYDTIACPSCATELQIAVQNKYDSRPLRCLESWSHKTEVEGLHSRHDDIRYESIPIRIHEQRALNFYGSHIHVDIDITEEQLYSNPSIEHIAHTIANKVFEKIVYQYGSPYAHSTPLHRRP